LSTIVSSSRWATLIRIFHPVNLKLDRSGQSALAFMSLSQESSKRAASSSPIRSPNRNLKRPRLLADLFSKDEHATQDDDVRKRLRRKDGTPKKLYADDEFDMAIVLNVVCEVLSQGPRSNLFHPIGVIKQYTDALEDPYLLELVGDAYTSGSYKYVRCLGTYFSHMFQFNYSNLVILEFLRKPHVSLPSQTCNDPSAPPSHITCY
jgi:hypothetical protein